MKKDPSKWIILITVMIASFLGRLDGTIVNLALPHIITDFGITISQASWISTAYIIANAIFVPIFGKLGDLIGRKPLYIFGIIGFTLSSALAGLSFNLNSMIIFRVLQAITVSIDYPLALSIIAFTFRDKQERAQAMGLWSAVFAVAQVFGPLLGGPLVDNFSWRSVFYVNIPLGAIGALMAIKYIREPVEKIKGIKNFDVLGAILLGISLGTMVLVLDQGQAWGWTDQKSVISYFVSVLSFIIFIIVENKAIEPVVDLKFFKIPTFSASIITSFISFMGMIGGIFLIPLFVQNTLGYSVTKSGYLFIPMSFSLMFMAQLGARLSHKIQPRFLIAGGMFFASIMLFLFTGLDVKWSFWNIALLLFFLAGGIGISLAPLTSAITSTVPLEEIGVASSVLALARNLAGAYGIAIFATILSNATGANIINILQNSTINNHQTISSVIPLVLIQANILAFRNVFYWAGIFMFLGSISALFVAEKKSDFAHQKIKNINLEV